jgi:hypothetical protein
MRGQLGFQIVTGGDERGGQFRHAVGQDAQAFRAIEFHTGTVSGGWAALKVASDGR